MACFVEDLHVITGHRHGRRADLDRQCLQPRWVACDGEAGFGLPPVVVDRFAQHVLRPDDGIRICPFAREVEGAQAAEVIFLDLQSFGVFAFHGADGCGCCEKAAHLVFRDHAPEGACIGRAHRFALEHHGGVAMDQRAIGDIAVAHDPAHVGCRPEHVAGIDVVDVLHGPV